MITIHCSANSNGSRCTGEDIRRYHMAPLPLEGVDLKKLKPEEAAKYGRGWSDIGYHGVAETCGGYFQGRPDDHLGAHVEDHNDGNLGFCFIGDTKFTLLQFECYRRWALSKMAAYRIPLEEIRGHYEFDTAKAQGKTCPNMKTEHLRAWVETGDRAHIEEYLL
jgi:hypothetical protein